MKKAILSPIMLLVTAAAALLGSCAQEARQKFSYRADADRVLGDSAAVALFLPLERIHSEYRGNAVPHNAPELSDSFFVEVANGLALFEISQRFRVSHFMTDSPDVKLPPRVLGQWSVLSGDTAAADRMAEFVRQVAARCSVDLVILPQSCRISHTAVRPKGWRGDKYDSPSYERPVSYTAQAWFHIQIWNRDGRLLCERSGYGCSGRPVLYTLLNSKEPQGDMASFAKRFFAPPLVKALNEAIQDATRVN